MQSIPMRKETYGDTEEIIGNWFEKTKKRDKVILATKVVVILQQEIYQGWRK